MRNAGNMPSHKPGLGTGFEQLEEKNMPTGIADISADFAAYKVDWSSAKQAQMYPQPDVSTIETNMQVVDAAIADMASQEGQPGQPARLAEVLNVDALLSAANSIGATLKQNSPTENLEFQAKRASLLLGLETLKLSALQTKREL